MLSRFHRILQRDGRMDRQTERIAISISRVSMLTRQKNVAAEAVFMEKRKKQNVP